MKKTNLRKSNGITLIALVITIIVLLILAGVAISMLSGENGILKKAAEAKTKTEEGQKQEETALATMELETYFLANNSPYKFCNGYLTGVGKGTEKDTVNVETVKENLPNGYEIYSYNKETKAFELAGKDEFMKTGMVIKKNGEKAGEVIVYGDLIPNEDYCGNGAIGAADMALLNAKLGTEDVDFAHFTDIQKIASDVNHDNIVDWKDVSRINEYASSSLSDLIDQNVFAQKANSIKVENKKVSRQNWVNSLNDSEKAKFAWQDEDEYYLYTTKSTTVEEILKNMPEAVIVRGNKKIGNAKTVEEGDRIMLYPDFETTGIASLFEIGIITVTE